ncbi:MAG: YlmC/YmxH family sporulation protein [Firmicutes bacterium]|nr:YlmC/YmxH family sporulation protein [Bacillota bacterium]
MVKISDLRMREVINVVDGRRLGPIKDIDINVDEGKILAVVLPGHQQRFMGFFGREEEIVVPWEKIVKIGIDVILVNLSFNDSHPQHVQGGTTGNQGEKFW